MLQARRKAVSSSRSSLDITEGTFRKCVSHSRPTKINKSDIYRCPVVDPGARFLVSASSNRGWHGDSTRTIFVHDIKPVQ